MATLEARGARQLSLRGIARQVGTGATSVYLHFPDLDQLLALVDEMVSRLMASRTPVAVN